MTGLVLYKEIADVLGAAGDAIIKITDGIRHLVVTGATGYSHIAAQRERKRLVEISAVATDLRLTHQGALVRSIDEYLESSLPKKVSWRTKRGWYTVSRGISLVLGQVRALLDDVREERSEFVLETAYEKLLEALAGRVSLLERLEGVPPPTTEQEREALREINNEYKRLLKAFGEVIQQLNVYLKSKTDA